VAFRHGREWVFGTVCVDPLQVDTGLLQYPHRFSFRDVSSCTVPSSNEEGETGP
jgi:hypothetical protein